MTATGRFTWYASWAMRDATARSQPDVRRQAMRPEVRQGINLAVRTLPDSCKIGNWCQDNRH